MADIRPLELEAAEAEGSARRQGQHHQAWMMHEINKLIWPSRNGIGQMDPAAWQHTAETALKFGVIKSAASKAPYTTDYATKALSGITDGARAGAGSRSSWHLTTRNLRSNW